MLHFFVFQFHVFPSELSWQRIFNSTFVSTSIDFWTSIEKSIEHDYVRIIKVRVFQAMLARHETVDTKSEHYSTRVSGSIPVRGNIFDEFILLQYNSGRFDRMIHLRKNSN